MENLDEIFANPGSAYRGAPFWAWNDRLDPETLREQIDVFQQMGMGGFHMHVRIGLDTPYMGKEFMDSVQLCVEEAKARGMKAYLYDEDRWPSGTAGGAVTADEQFAARYISFSPRREAGARTLAAYRVRLDEQGCLADWARVAPDLDEEGLWYANEHVCEGCGRHNGHAYVDVMNPRAIQRFVALTHEKYAARFGKEFGQTIPSIFTDEPHFLRKQHLPHATDRAAVVLPWTDDLPDTYREAYGADIWDTLPEVIWNLPDGRPSLARYRYHDHTAERFAAAFSDTVGAWCDAHGLALTGHLDEEGSLESQAGVLGEAMRNYRGFTLPGIDMLCSRFEYATAKQCQSAVHQRGRGGMMSELYGVTNWDFDFAGHKLHGDWQAALGVTLRVPHLSWMTMAGANKRDYPASIFFQSPWWRSYHVVEDHFARLNVALRQGKPLVRVAVVHPIESYWLQWGPEEQTAGRRSALQARFEDIAQWLLFGGVDFDYLCEAELPALCPVGGAPLRVGEMAYDAVVVSGCETLRSTTCERLEAFARAGGLLIVAGEAPKWVDAQASPRGEELAALGVCVAATRPALLDALAPVRQITLRDERGRATDNLLHQFREDGETRWLFIAHGKKMENRYVPQSQRITITLKGQYRPVRYETVTGKIEPIAYRAAQGKTEIETSLNPADSLLLRLIPCEESACTRETPQPQRMVRLPVPDLVSYTLTEPNALLLDQAEYALDGGPWQEREELLRIGRKVREKLGWSNDEVQPYTVARERAEHTLYLRVPLMCQCGVRSPRLMVEGLEGGALLLDGQPVALRRDGWYVDKSLPTYALPMLAPGLHVLEARLPLGKRTMVEWMYLLGDFGVRVRGRRVEVVSKEKQLGFSSITNQGLPFYGGNVTYHVPFASHGGGLRIRVPHFAGVALEVALDDEAPRCMGWPPYEMAWPEVAPGPHTAHITLLGHRRNGFGPVHLADLQDQWIGQAAWRSEGDRWTYEYRLCEEGVLSAPILEEIMPESGQF